MPRKSRALHNFNSSIAIAETLLKKEKTFPDPPSSRSRKFVEGLRGGATILMVAAFENYLKEVVEERLDELVNSRRFNITKLPEKMIFHNYRQTLHFSVYGPFVGNPSRAQKITGLMQASQLVVDERINPEAFTALIRSNPNSERVRELFKIFGLSDIFLSIRSDFDTRTGRPNSGNYIPDTLDAILLRRHIVAHTAKALNVSRMDLDLSLKFLKILVELIDYELYRHIYSLKQLCQ